VVEMKDLFSVSARQLKSSKIRELMKMANTPGIISMAGGMPDSESFPFDEIKGIINSWPYTRAKVALQYGTTRGYIPLLQKIAQWMEQVKNIGMENQEVIITTGSQQALSLISKIFLDPNDVVLVEIPSFIGAIASFYSFMGTVVGISMDEEGIIMDDLVKKIEDSRKSGKAVKLIYTIPNFNNPSGITLSPSRRKKLLEISYNYEIPLVEDDPYGELFYEGIAEDYAPIKSLDERGTVFYLGTFSKVLSPGIRVGWIVGDREVVAKLELQKQSFDACTSTLSQLIAHDYLKNGYITQYTEKMKSVYRNRRDATLNALKAHMPEGVHWTRPNGGLFVWVTIPVHLDAEDVFKEAVKEKVAFVTGDAFLPEGYKNNYIRLAFSDLSPERIEEGIAVLADVLQRMM